MARCARSLKGRSMKLFHVYCAIWPDTGDFVIERRGAPPLAIECKWRYRSDRLSGLQVFARHYPEAPLLVVAADAQGVRTIRCGSGVARLLSLEDLVGFLISGGDAAVVAA